ncbi:tetraacyldisaccharide 4'-kinase [Marivirga arenosa]|uniref:Tetraacyldisaccharide 4'-kinase n=1 Tax=Marivirga arenosa TaxID=3059076 RepID=A0AA49GCA3_9BACT|nr:tetraacyldisaccharide 4'-kinase [Marivirga sp. BKB1-2]WKK81359.2 tetraacyldisaccharide 4'-kinase [Marivirga sp. BKB1-2]
MQVFKNKYWQLLMAPFSILYKWIMQFRNHLYDIEYKAVFNFEPNVIGVGNLSMGGTGKTPFVEYLIRYFISTGKSNKVATLSRGYGRKTKGFRLATDEDSASSLGDEPFQIYEKFKKDIRVSVGEDRVLAIPSIILENSEVETIIMDDGFQHRSVKPKFSILLSDYNNPFYDDFVLPSGTLRESRRGVRRADAIIITKCPDNLTDDKKTEIKNRILSYTDKKVFFTKVDYQEVKHTFDKRKVDEKIILVTGIAHSGKFKSHLIESGYKIMTHFDFPDHHNFSKNDIQKIYESAKNQNADILTTEKDWVRLISHKGITNEIKSMLFYLPIVVQFLEDEKSFQQLLEDSIRRT